MREGRRRFLRGLGAAVLGAAVAPTAARMLTIGGQDAGASASDGDRRLSVARPGMRWIGHF